VKALNLGCGHRAHPSWENLDLVPAMPIVRAHDLRKGIPYSDGTFDVVYHSHLLEHFPKQVGFGFLKECHRVMKSGGVVRVAVPDLEHIARTYLAALEKASLGLPGWRENYEWMILELLDQMVRISPGGLCREYLRQNPVPNSDFIYDRWGAEAKAAVDAVRVENSSPVNGRGHTYSKSGFHFMELGKTLFKKLAWVVLSEENYEALKAGRLRTQGEIHQWMYDAYSLAQLLQQVGFCNCRRCDATESQIPNWTHYQLDSEAGGFVYKPDSLFMEAMKP
jgi:SAM-dependent methyltransferase